MKTLLSDLWNGNIDPSGEAIFRSTEESELNKLIEQYKNKLEEMIDETGKNILLDLDDCYTELQCLLREEAFINGFSLGVKLILESMANHSQP